MYTLSKLVRNGNCTMITIPRRILHHLEWVPGAFVVATVTEDHQLLVRAARESDLDPRKGWPSRQLTSEEAGR